MTVGNPDISVLDPQMRRTFDMLNDSNVAYVVLRGFRPLSELNESVDVDIYIPESDLEKARKAIFCSGWRERRYQVGRFPHIFFDSWEGQGSVVRSLDIVTSLCFGKNRHVLERGHYVAETGELLHGVRVPSPWLAAFAFTLHVALDKGVLSPANEHRAREMLEECRARPDARSVLTEGYGAEAADLVDALQLMVAGGESGSIGSIASQARKLTVLHKHPIFALGNRLKTRLRDLARPVIRIAFLGCDGAGKSTLTQRLRESSSALRIHTAYLGANEYLTPPARFLQSRMSHYKGTRSETSLGYRIWCNLEELWWPAEVLARMLYAEHRSALVLYDRFPFRQERPADRPRTPWGWVMGVYKRIAMLPVPMPDVVVFLDGDPQTIWSRKKEYSFETYLEVRDGYRDLLGRLPCETYVIPADQGVETAFLEVRKVLASSSVLDRKLYLPASDQAR